jgi:CubicO group peptidase (beta-lactamase class C family)
VLKKTIRPAVDMADVDRRMRQAVAESVFPGGVLLAACGDRVLIHSAYGCSNLLTKRPMTTATLFDLASLTKPLATTLAVMLLCQQGRIGLDQHLGNLLPELSRSDKADVTIAQLLAHTSGLPDYRPFYLQIAPLAVCERRPRLRRLLVQEPLVHKPGERVLYSDLDFMILEWVVETISGRRLDRFVAEAVYASLNIAPLFFIDLEHPAPPGAYAATEQCPWRGCLVESQVHDENAYALGGIAGHAGLFGTAAAIHGLLSALASAYHGRGRAGLFHRETVRRFFQQAPGTGKALGFDMPSATDPSCGRFFPPTSVGHLGFTGTSFWLHPEQCITVVLLTNRVHPTRANIAIRRFRPLIHDAVMEAVARGCRSGPSASAAE